MIQIGGFKIETLLTEVFLSKSHEDLALVQLQLNSENGSVFPETGSIVQPCPESATNSPIASRKNP